MNEFYYKEVYTICDRIRPKCEVKLDQVKSKFGLYIVFLTYFAGRDEGRCEATYGSRQPVRPSADYPSEIKSIVSDCEWW
jgi:hypothetical protein